MNNTAAYTPLESLLLFQSLLAFGTEPGAFSRISDLLTHCDLVKDAETYDPARLNPDALRDLYQHLLREEIHDEIDSSDLADHDAASKKRKLQAPPSPSIRDASQYLDKLPHLVERLYTRYRAYKIRLIREDERRYEALQREIKEIENGEWDDRILEEDASRVNGRSRADDVRSVSSESSRTTKETDVTACAAPALKATSPAAPAASSPTLTAPLFRSNTSEAAANGQNGAPTATPTTVVDHSVTTAPATSAHVAKAAQKPDGQWKWQEQYPPTSKKPHPGHANQHLAYPYNQYPQRGYPANLPSSPHPPPHQILLSQGNRPTGSPTRPEDAALRGPQTPQTAQGTPAHRPALPSQHRPGETGVLPATASPRYAQLAAQFPQGPFGLSTPQMQRSVLYGRPDLQPPEGRQYTSPYSSSSTRASELVTGTITPKTHVSPASSQPQTPVSQTAFQHKTGRATRWTPTPSSNTPKAPRSPARPTMEPLSPVTHKERASKSNGDVGQPRRPRPRGPLSKETVVSPAPSTRRSSIVSHPDEVSVDDSMLSRVVKQESATPRMVEDTEDTTADESTTKKPDRRPRPRPSKRKRNVSVSGSGTPPSHVLWTRNFPSISTYTLQAITSHRYASTFAAPVKERDAPGYKDIILQPQDLKSIRSAVTAGHRAAAAAAAANGSDNGQASLWLPMAEDLVPPKGIINSAQLENEVIRMFANAIMYNADPNRGLGKLFHDSTHQEPTVSDNYEVDENGVVNETRAMFIDVERTLTDFRATNRRRDDTSADEDEDEDELADENHGSAAKRRRRA